MALSRTWAQGGQADIDTIDSGAEHGGKKQGADGADSSGSVLVDLGEGAEHIAPAARLGHRGERGHGGEVGTWRDSDGAFAQRNEVEVA